MQNVGFSVQLQSENPFGCIPVDQTTERTVNKDTKAPGDTTGYSLNTGAVNTLYLTSESRTGFVSKLKDAMDSTKTVFYHQDLMKSRVPKDENDVSDIIELVNSWTNPFINNDLASLSTATKALAKLEHDLLQAKEIAELAFMQFIDNRLA